MHVATLHAVHGKGVRGGKFLRENFKKWCNLLRFSVYFDQMFLKIILKFTIFTYKLIYMGYISFPKNFENM